MPPADYLAPFLMLRKHIFYIVLSIASGLGNLQDLHAQEVEVRGHVYDISQRVPVPAVSVMSNSGRGTVTDTLGAYRIVLPPGDSLWFSYLGKPTPKFAIQNIPKLNSFDIAIQFKTNNLPTVTISRPGYRLDSLRFRQEYAKYFNYKRPGLGIADAPLGSGNLGAGAGFDLDALINVFRFGYNQRQLSFQRQLIQYEQDKYIDHRFTRLLVEKLTHLHGLDLDAFLLLYRPRYEMLLLMSESELGTYILHSLRQYQRLPRQRIDSIKHRITG